ncbi:MAG: hypothetical protein M1818_002324 [Claussenomyces sp. TS43310]|nr:MAG: hypothetical protein M1818_002324 [Claussenomyces sp. TS43310]
MVYNIAMAFLPLVGPKDDLSDIPLTPAQRKLLGLAPSSAPPTPGSQYATPPRYARTPTPLKGSPSNGNLGSSISGKGSAAQDSPRGSPFSPNASPLLHKAMGGMSSIRRPSYGSPSPLGPAAQKTWLEGPNTPSPTVGKGASGVGLNSKWLYERGRGSPGNGSLFSTPGSAKSQVSQISQLRSVCHVAFISRTALETSAAEIDELFECGNKYDTRPSRLSWKLAGFAGFMLAGEVSDFREL